jgi:hypothetical protein
MKHGVCSTKPSRRHLGSELAVIQRLRLLEVKEGQTTDLSEEADVYSHDLSVASDG